MRTNDGSRTNLEQNLKFERISVAHGLSHSTVNCILQDRYGFMWFGTDDGLNKYDGYSFTVYRHDPDDARRLVGLPGSCFIACYAPIQPTAAPIRTSPRPRAPGQSA
jgi:hypothetical protein